MSPWALGNCDFFHYFETFYRQVIKLYKHNREIDP